MDKYIYILIVSNVSVFPPKPSLLHPQPQSFGTDCLTISQGDTCSHGQGVLEEIHGGNSQGHTPP